MADQTHCPQQQECSGKLWGGRFAAQTLLREAAPISKLRGRWHSYQGIPLMPTFHPAYLLRNPAEKREVWEDMKRVRAILAGNA